MIFVHGFIQNITVPLYLIYLFFLIWTENLSLYIGDLGCYSLIYVSNFSLTLFQAHSFFCNMFRYFCIVHSNFLSQYEIQPKVSTHGEISLH